MAQVDDAVVEDLGFGGGDEEALAHHELPEFGARERPLGPPMKLPLGLPLLLCSVWVACLLGVCVGEGKDEVLEFLGQGEEPGHCRRGGGGGCGE